MAWRRKVYTSELNTAQTTGGGGGEGPAKLFFPRDFQEENTDLLVLDLETKEVSVFLQDIWQGSLAHQITNNPINTDYAYTGRWTNSYNWWYGIGEDLSPGEFHFVKINLRTGDVDTVLVYTVDDNYSYGPLLNNYDSLFMAYNEDRSQFFFLFTHGEDHDVTIARVETETMTVTLWEDVYTKIDHQLECFQLLDGKVYFCDDVDYPDINWYELDPETGAFSSTTFPYPDTGNVYWGFDDRRAVPYNTYPMGPEGGSYPMDNKIYLGYDQVESFSWASASGTGAVEDPEYEMAFYIVAPGVVRLGDVIVVMRNYRKFIVIDVNDNSYHIVDADPPYDPQVDPDTGDSVDYWWHGGILMPWSATEVAAVQILDGCGAESNQYYVGYWVIDITSGDITEVSQMELTSGETGPPGGFINSNWFHLASLPGGGSPLTTTITPYGLYKVAAEPKLLGYTTSSPPPKSTASSGNPWGVETILPDDPNKNFTIRVGDDGKLYFFQGETVYIYI
jgi:hypothetical protein